MPNCPKLRQLLGRNIGQSFRQLDRFHDHASSGTCWEKNSLNVCEVRTRAARYSALSSLLSRVLSWTTKTGPLVSKIATTICLDACRGGQENTAWCRYPGLMKIPTREKPLGLFAGMAGTGRGTGGARGIIGMRLGNTDGFLQRVAKFG